MSDLRNPLIIQAKGWLFLLGGVLAGSLLWLERPTLKVAVLLMLTVWCFARFYYFAFYVLQHYVDEDYRFAGLLDFARYYARRRG